jgi:hypothetical protein
MSDHDNARRAPMPYMAAARAYCFDLTAIAFLFVSVSILAGRVWRFPFDDEIATLTKIEPDTARELIATFPATDDIHPPFSYLLFYGLRQLDFSDAAMRLCSLLLTFLALALCHSLVLRWLSWRADAGTLPSPTRIVAVLIFGLMPLAVSQGDALRWYPVFAMLIALFLVLYLEPRDEWQRLWSGVALGLAASTDFSAALIVPPFLFYRHVLQRRFRLVVRSNLLAHRGGWRRDRFLVRLLYIHLPHPGCADRILRRRHSFRSDRRAWILRRGCSRN